MGLTGLLQAPTFHHVSVGAQPGEKVRTAAASREPRTFTLQKRAKSSLGKILKQASEECFVLLATYPAASYLTG
jgi:hypothetical protein